MCLSFAFFSVAHSVFLWGRLATHFQPWGPKAPPAEALAAPSLQRPQSDHPPRPQGPCCTALHPPGGGDTDLDDTATLPYGMPHLSRPLPQWSHRCIPSRRALAQNVPESILGVSF